MNDFGLSERDLKFISNFFKQFDEIYEVKIFGSRARGDYRRSSDVDLAVFSSADLDFITLSYIKEGLEATPALYHFDIVNYRNLENENLKKDIDEDGKVIYKA